MNMGYTNPHAGTETEFPYRGKERRSKPRLLERFRATVHGVNARGHSFMLDTELENLSAGGLYLRLADTVEVGTELLVVSKLSKPSNGNSSGPLVAMNGVVVRVEDAGSDMCGVAVEFTETRLL